MATIPPTEKTPRKAAKYTPTSLPQSSTHLSHAILGGKGIGATLTAVGAAKSRAPRIVSPQIGAPTIAPRPKAPFVLLGIATYSLAAYGTYVYFSLKNIPGHSHQGGQQTDRSHVYENIANKYDREIWASEFFMGMPLLRRSLGKRVEGNVLEVSAGTGRNLEYYSLKKCNSVTMVDTSTRMLGEARRKFKEQYPKYKNVDFIVQDAAEPIESPLSMKGYDTVIQSMGLCSHRSPVELLRNLGNACKKDGGKIILLEHGRSHYEWLNNILDSLAPKHADKWGCWWNRDVEGILKESGLVVDKVSRYHFGTTYWIEARPAELSSSVS